jgi:hypothetical protein
MIEIFTTAVVLLVASYVIVILLTRQEQKLRREHDELLRQLKEPNYWRSVVFYNDGSRKVVVFHCPRRDLPRLGEVNGEKYITAVDHKKLS